MPISSPRKPNSIGLRSKFVLLVSALLAIIFSLFAFFLISNNTQTLRTNLFEEARAFAVLATDPIGTTFAIYKDSGTEKIEEEVRDSARLNESISNIAVIDVAGNLLYVLYPDQELDVTAEEAATFDSIYRTNENGVLDTIIFPYFEASGAHRYSVVYTVSDDKIEETVRLERMSSVAFAIFALLLTGTSIYLLINILIIRPIESVSEQAEIISSGDLDQQIMVRTNDEIGRLSDSVNKMADSLKKNIAELKEIDKVKSEFMMITSHNLRTPLTIISGYMENADRYEKDPVMQAQIINRISSSIKRLEMFAEDVLTISRFELGEQEQNLETIELKHFLENITADFIQNAATKQIEFITDIRLPDVAIEASAPHIRSAIWNLLDNALKFTPEGGVITVIATKENDKAKISIKDSGIGITPEELPKLFTKFHRGTSTLTYDFGGTGIGLYASKMMIENYGGTITAESIPGEGSTFTVALPYKK